VIAFVDNHPKENQNAWIDRVDISINGKSINNMCVSDFYGDNINALDSSYITPLFLSDNSTVLSIPDIKDKQIIGLGESTHGSVEIKESCYQFMKALILEDNCQAVLFEKSPDMCLKWDLYVNGKISGEIEQDMETEVKCYFDDAGLFMDFLNWLRDYNETVHSKVHIFGFNTFSQPYLFFFDYFSLLLGKTESLPYLRLLKDKKYQEIIDYAMKDMRLQSILDVESFEYLLFLLTESGRAPTITNGGNDGRETDMWKRVDKIIQLYMKENNKIVLHAHSSHTNKASDFFFDVEDKPSMGSYIYHKYGETYFSIGFQVGEGLYTQDETGMFSKAVTDSIQIPVMMSLEYTALKTNNSYFYYPANKLPYDIMSIRAIAREKKGLDQFVFCSINKRFDGVVFVRDNSPLDGIVDYPFFYTSDLIRQKHRCQLEILDTIEQ
jgi:erythromycin esterase-like protein